MTESFPNPNEESSEECFRKIDEVLGRCELVKSALNAVEKITWLEKTAVIKKAGSIKQHAKQTQLKIMAGIPPERQIINSVNDLLTQINQLEQYIQSKL